MEATLNLSTFNPKVAELAELAERYSGLTIAGVEDKEGYKRVHDAQMIIRNKRLEIDGQKDIIQSQITEYQRSLTGQYRERIDILRPIEDALKAEKKRIDDEKEAIRKAKEQEELERIRLDEERVSSWMTSLARYGCILSIFDVKAMTQSEYATLLAEKKEAYEKAQEELRAQEAETRRLREVQAACEKREREEFEKRKADIEAREKAIREAEEKIFREENIRKIQEGEKKAKAERERQKKEDERRIELARTARMESEKAFQEFLKGNGYTEKTKGNFHITREGRKVVLWMKKGEWIDQTV